MPTLTRAGYRPPKGSKGTKAAKPPKGPGKKPGKKKKKRRGIGAAGVASLAVFALAALVGAATLYLYAAVSPYRETFAPGTSFEGAPLALYGYEDGEAVVRQATDPRVEEWRFEISCMGTSYVLTAQDVGLHIDMEKTLAPLWARGKGNLIGAWLDMADLRRAPQDAQAVPAYDLAAADDLLALIKAEVDCPPQDASVTFTPGDSEPFRYEPETVGLALDTALVRERIEASLLSMTPDAMTAEPKELAPGVYAADLEAASVLRARVTLTLMDDEAAFANAALAAQALNGAMITPGASLSFNEAAGARSEARGYAEAPEPAYGADARGVGGGVCQTATALYQAALLGGVPVTERHAAAQVVPYAEAGQEAAVSDQGLDLVLHNEGSTPLYVTARAYEDGDARRVEVQIIGAPLGARYALASQVQALPAPEEPVYVRDSEGLYATYADERVPVSEAREGARAQVDLVTLGENGEEIARERIGTDEYAPVAQAVYVGIRQREE